MTMIQCLGEAPFFLIGDSMLKSLLLLFRTLFLHLFIPVFQRALDKWVKFYNGFCRRHDKRSKLPTGCSADYCYKNPVDEFGGIEYLIPVPGEAVDAILADEYPEQEHLWSTTPEWFSPVVDQVMEEVGIVSGDLDIGNFWGCFDVVLARLKDLSWSNTPFARVEGHDSMVLEN